MYIVVCHAALPASQYYRYSPTKPKQIVLEQRYVVIVIFAVSYANWIT